MAPLRSPRIVGKEVLEDQVTGKHFLVQERDINITFVTIFSCGSVWKREILMKIGSRWTQNCKNGTSPKIIIFFIFYLYTNEKWKK